MNFIKKQAVGFFLSAATALLGIVSIIAFYVMAKDNEGISESVYVLTSLGVLLCIANMVLAQFQRTNTLFSYGNGISAILFGASVVMFFVGRMTWFMNLASKNNVTPMHAAFIVAAAMFLVMFIVSIVNGFMKIKK